MAATMCTGKLLHLLPQSHFVLLLDLEWNARGYKAEIINLSAPEVCCAGRACDFCSNQTYAFSIVDTVRMYNTDT